MEIEASGRAKEAWLRQFLELPWEIPSHDTLGDVFARLDPEAFRACFMSWVRAVFVATEGQAVDMVSAWATQVYLVLGHLKGFCRKNMEQRVR